MSNCHPMNIRIQIALVLLLTPLTTSAVQQDLDKMAPNAISEETQKLISARCVKYLSDLREERNFPGCSAALVLPDGSVLSFPIGLADVEAERPMSADDRLLSGSIGKTYVTAAAHKLMLAKKLSWDQCAIEFFEDEDWFLRVPNAKTMTLKHLLRHQSGIARHVFKPEFFRDCYAEPDRVWKPMELLSYIFDDEPLFEAGAAWAYADTNYIVLGMIIEKVTGQRFYDYVKDEFLKPLELRDTVASNTRRIPGLTQGYVVAFKEPGVPDRVLADGAFFYNPQFEWCGGGYASSASDLARWAHALYGGTALEGDYLTSMLDAVPARLGPNKRYGLGVIITPTSLGNAVGHDGIMTGFGATVSHYPDHGVSAALMLNTDDPRVMGVPLDRVTLQLAMFAVEELEN